MGWAKRSRKKLSRGTLCYLCCQEISPDEEWNRDHVPPQRFYGKSVRDRFNPNMDWLPCHTTCNSAYRSDEECFVMCLAGHAETLAGRSVFDDIRRGAAQGHALGLLRQVISQFGRVALADGSVIFNYDADRIGRIVWKLARAIYYEDTGGRVLPESKRHGIINLSARPGTDPAQAYPLFTHVRAGDSMGSYPGVFDYKWISVAGESVRGHAIGMLMWDKIMFMAVFHDPTCSCDDCRHDAAQQNGDGNREGAG